MWILITLLIMAPLAWVALSVYRACKTDPGDPDRAKYRLVPDGRGTYTLERLEWVAGRREYSSVAVSVSPEEAKRTIKNLEMDILYPEEGK